MTELFASTGDPDQMPQNAASDLGLHCLPITLLGVSRLKWAIYTKSRNNAYKLKICILSHNIFVVIYFYVN